MCARSEMCLPWCPYTGGKQRFPPTYGERGARPTCCGVPRCRNKSGQHNTRDLCLAWPGGPGAICARAFGVTYGRKGGEPCEGFGYRPRCFQATFARFKSRTSVGSQSGQRGAQVVEINPDVTPLATHAVFALRGPAGRWVLSAPQRAVRP